MLEKLQEIWANASMAQRTVLLTVALGCVAAAVFLVGWAGQPEYALLYSNLTAEEAAQIVEKVRDAGVRYELKNGGTTIYVEADQVYATRLSMAEQGLPTGEHPGYSILDDRPIGQSPLTQRINHTRAIEGELAKSIQAIQGVSGARVHIARPEAKLFGAEQESSATVVLKLVGGRRLAPGSVWAVVHLVAGGVEGLVPEKVVVVDSRGNLLSGEDTEGQAKRAFSALDYQMQVEQYLAEKAEDMLAAHLGPNRTSVKVSAAVDMTSQTETVTTYTAGDSLVKRESTEKTPVATSGGAEAAPPSAAVSEETEYFDPPQTVRMVEGIPGQVTLVTASALVDLTTPAEPAAEGESAVVPTLTQQDVQEIIAKAIGAKPEDVTVKPAKFHQVAPSPAVELADEGMFNQAFLLEMARRSSLGLLVIGALLALKMFGGARGKGQAQAALAAEATPALAAETVGGEHLLPAGDETMTADALRTRISSALQENPEEVKRLFLSWVESEKGGA